MKILLSIVFAVSVCCLLPSIGMTADATAQTGDPAKQIRQLTGAETRIVWIRNKQWESTKGGVDGGAGFPIMAFDTGGKGERELVPEGEIYNPLISPSGRSRTLLDWRGSEC